MSNIFKSVFLKGGFAVAVAALAVSFAHAVRAAEGREENRAAAAARLRVTPDGTWQKLDALKAELTAQSLNTQQKPARAREIIDHLLTMASAWPGTALESFAAIRPFCADPRPRVREEAAFAIGFLGDRYDDLSFDAMTTLTALVRDKDAGVRRTAAGRIGVIGKRSMALRPDARVALEFLQGDVDERTSKIAESGSRALPRPGSRW